MTLLLLIANSLTLVMHAGHRTASLRLHDMILFKAGITIDLEY